MMKVNFMICFVIFSSVNVAHDTVQNLQGTASMSEPPQQPAWSASNAVDGNTAQETLTTCAVMDYLQNYKSVWWKVQLQKRYNVAYLVVYFRRSSMSFSLPLTVCNNIHFITKMRSTLSVSRS